VIFFHFEHITNPTTSVKKEAEQEDEATILSKKKLIVDVLYAAPQVHGIVNVALHWEYSPGIVFIFF
jgi:hypothetical protein